MLRLFSVHVHDAAVSVRLQSIYIGHRGAPTGSGLPCPGYASELWAYRKFTSTFAAALVVASSIKPTHGVAPLFHTLASTLAVPIAPDKTAVRKVPYESDALSDWSVAVVAMAMWRVWTWSGVGVHLEGILHGSNTR